MPDDTRRWPRISVITPSYNQGQFLGECLDSVFRQDYPDLEVLVIDGGSTDGSVGIIKANEPRLAYWCSEPDAGQGDAINKGLRLATGELVAWLNADDSYLPGALTRVARAYQQNPHASFYFGDGLRVDKNGDPVGGFFPGGHVGFDLRALVYGLNCLLQPATFINRASLSEVGPLDPALRYGLDTDLWIRLAAHAPPSPVAAPLAASREYPETKTATGSFARVEELRQIAERYGGVAMTPGALCYFLDTLLRLARERRDIFPESYEQSIRTFWGATAKLLADYGAGADGFPLSGRQPEGVHTEEGEDATFELRRSAAALLRRVVSKAWPSKQSDEA
jgi:glycosyltransferase involved in cell wall biosynthesis